MADIDKEIQKIAISKNAIKNAINNKGGSVTDSTPLADYAQAIENIPSGGGGRKVKQGAFTTKVYALSAETVDYNENLKGVKLRTYSYSTSAGYPVKNISGIKPLRYNSNSYGKETINEAWTYDNSPNYPQFKDLIIRQVWTIDDIMQRTSWIETSRIAAFMATERSNSYPDLNSNYYSFGVEETVKASGSSYYADLWAIYTGGGAWRDFGGIQVNLGDVVDLTWEFEDENTLVFTKRINFGNPIVTKITSSNWDKVTNFANAYLVSLSFAGNIVEIPNGVEKRGVVTTLLEGTSIYDKNLGKYRWQLFEEVKE